MLADDARRRVGRHLTSLEVRVSTTARDVLLLVLAAASGAADGWSYMGLGHAFVANMTGNTVLLGLAIFANHDLLHTLVALAGYAAGTAAATLLTRSVAKQHTWARPISRVLLIEGLLLLGVAVVWSARLLGVAWALEVPLEVLLAGAAIAIGMQSGAMLKLGVPGVVTTYITGTWTALISGGVGLRLSGKREAPAQTRMFEERLLLQSGILAAYFLAALLTGFLSSRMPVAMGALPAVAVLSASVSAYCLD